MKSATSRLLATAGLCLTVPAFATQQCISSGSSPAVYGTVTVTISGSGVYDCAGNDTPYPWTLFQPAAASTYGFDSVCTYSFSKPIATSSITIGLQSQDQGILTIATNAGPYVPVAGDIIQTPIPISDPTPFTYIDDSALTLSGAGFTTSGAPRAFPSKSTGEASGYVKLTNAPPATITSLSLSNSGASSTYTQICFDDGSSAPGSASGAEPVPTLSELAMAGLSVMLALSAGVALRRRT